MKNDGGPAFPVSWQDGDGQMIATPGMSLRDYFAGQAIGYIWAQNPRQAATLAYAVADAMLAARSAETQNEQ